MVPVTEVVLLIVLMFLFRDGDVVAIRASAGGKDSFIKENHPLDTTA